MSNILKAAFFFLVLALLAGALGYGGFAAQAEGMAKFLFGVFGVLFVLLLLVGLFVVKKVTDR
ncbi:MAG: DUF1328 family protein [Bdellovibrionota bacterium]